MKKVSRNDLVLIICAALVVGMVGLSYAAVPLYYLFCEATGYGGTVSRADGASKRVEDHTITVRFDTNVDPALGWNFEPEQRKVTVKLGENKLVFFRATNEEAVPVIGHAAFNVTPGEAAVYFKKIECFCFKEQRLEAGQTIEMPVSFFVDPALFTSRDARGIDEITLSYTFYRAVDTSAAKPASTKVNG
jgi:cytochrome c oxidase assembly protein subunit 11